MQFGIFLTVFTSVRLARKGISVGNIITIMGHLQKIYIQDGKSKMQHYFLLHSPEKFPGENETSCSSCSNFFLVNVNDLCK